MTRRYAQLTELFRRALTEVALALAGRAGARLATTLGMSVGRDTLWRLIRALPDPAVGDVRVLGVDDFAVRRGHRYGTIMIGLEAGRPVDLIEGRDGDALASWLTARALPEVVCRDRAGGYAEGIRKGAPQAVQVADRFHVWQNLCQAVERDVSAARPALAAKMSARHEQRRSGNAPKIVQHRELKVVSRLRANYAAVHELLSQGLSQAAIGRQLGLHPATVRKFVHAETVEKVIAVSQQRASILDGYHEHLHRRWNDGVRNATQLTREIAELGYPGTEQQVQRYLRRFRVPGASEVEIPAPRPPSVRDVTTLITSHPDNLDKDDTTALRRIRGLSKDLDRLTGHVKDFAVMLTRLEGHRLEQWIGAAENDRTLSALASFARNLRRDLDAVRNGLTLAHNSGPVEGHINRLKMLKRQMFGRANFDLLRKRTPHHN